MSIAPKIVVGTRIRFKCNTCKLVTNHELKAFHQRHWEEEYDTSNPYNQPLYWEVFEFRFWVCLGCDTAMLQEVWAPMGDVEAASSEYHPKRKGRDREIKEYRQLDRNLNNIYREVVTGYNSGLRIVCAMGLRALLEGICVNRGITDTTARGLEAKLRKLEEDKHLPSNIVEYLHSFKFMGDGAAHRLEAPSLDEIGLAIDVMEDLLNFLYEMEYQLTSKAKKLAERRSAQFEEVRKRREKRSKQNTTT